MCLTIWSSITLLTTEKKNLLKIKSPLKSEKNGAEVVIRLTRRYNKYSIFYIPHIVV